MNEFLREHVVFKIGKLCAIDLDLKSGIDLQAIKH